MPVHFLRTRNVPGVVKEDVFVALDDSDVRVVEMLGQPACGHENLRVNVTLAGNAGINVRCIACDCRPHGSLLKKESF